MNTIPRRTLVAGAAGAAVADLSRGAQTMEHVVIHRDDTQYYICPWMTRLDNGDLIITVREAQRRPFERIAHADPTARGVLIRSRDGGRTWGNKTVIDNQNWRFSQTEDVPVIQLSDKSLLVNLYSWYIGNLPKGKPTPAKGMAYTMDFEGISFIRSTDRGWTWSERQPLRVPGLPDLLSSRCPVVEHPDGSLLLTVAHYEREPVKWARTWCIRSRDKGRAWELVGTVAADPSKQMNYLEGSFTRLRSGKLLTLLRTDVANHEPSRGWLFQSESTDDGKTWTPPAKSVIWGFPAHVLELRDGRLLATYGHRRPPYGVRACISRDQGKTWDIDKEIVLRDDGGTSDLGYPSTVEFGDGRVLTIYWFNTYKEGDPNSEVRYIAGTFFRP